MIVLHVLLTIVWIVGIVMLIYIYAVAAMGIYRRYISHKNTNWHDSDFYDGLFKKILSDMFREGYFYSKHDQQKQQVVQDYQDISDDYVFLGVAPGSTKEDVDKAYKKKAWVYHPDVPRLPREEAVEKMKELNGAYERIVSRMN